MEGPPLPLLLLPGLLLLSETAMSSTPLDEAVLFCVNKGGPVQLRWRLPPPSTTSIVIVIVNPTGEEVLAWVEGEVRVARAYQGRVEGTEERDGQIQLKLKRVSSEDAGKYVCREESVRGLAIPDCSQVLYYVDIQRPSISIGHYPVLGQLLILTCLARLPYPMLDLGLSFSFQWLKDDVIIEGERGRELIKPQLAKEDKGRYACRVTEDSQSCATSAESKPVHVHVMMGPTLRIRAENGTKNSNGSAETPGKITLSVGTALTLVCGVMSASPPVPADGYNWTLTTSGSRLPHQLPESSSTLRLRNLTRAQDGEYTCRARNDEGFEGLIPTGQASIRVSVSSAIADQEFHAPAPLTVCLSRSTQASVTLQRPKGCASEELVVVTHASTARRMEAADAGEREVLQWHPVCNTSVAAEYRDRVSVTCDPKLCQLQLQLTDVTVEDQGQLVCRNEAIVGPPLDKCGASLRVVDVADLQQSCSYSLADRTVCCDKVTSEVKVYRKGEWSDRDIRYFSTPFHFWMGDREEGKYAVTQVNRTEEDALCSGGFEFQVEKHVLESSGLSYKEVVIGVVCTVAVLLFILLPVVVIVIKKRRKLRPRQEQPGSETERPQVELGSLLEEEAETAL